MAEWNDRPPDHPREAAGQRRRRSTMTLNTAEQVAQQTADVFRSYAFYRYQHEQAENMVEIPVDPEISELPQSESTTTTDVGRRLAVIGDDINNRYDSDFREMLISLQPDMHNAYKYFTKIASSLFEDGINWGRVIALLGFGYRMALHVYHHHGIRGFLTSIAEYIARFVLQNKIAEWIMNQGGWVAALTLDNVYFKYVVAALAIVLIGQFVVCRFLGR
ncbi:bcl-2 homologous antagonist/killer [Ambystoma mexicanum]|uniref:bcl-2 homologous antagonist/killer n=1 Tax=Ambystoma mexicanum TaxID=8296 RepID=UPI0037E8345B